MPRLQDTLPGLACRARKRCANPLLLTPLRLAPESKERDFEPADLKFIHDSIAADDKRKAEEAEEQRRREAAEKEEQERRLRDAAEEIRNYSQYDYVLVNREVEMSVDTLVSIVKATRSRRDRMEEQIRPILETFRNG